MVDERAPLHRRLSGMVRAGCGPREAPVWRAAARVLSGHREAGAEGGLRRLGSCVDPARGETGRRSFTPARSTVLGLAAAVPAAVAREMWGGPAQSVLAVANAGTRGLAAVATALRCDPRSAGPGGRSRRAERGGRRPGGWAATAPHRRIDLCVPALGLLCCNASSR